MCSLVSQCHNIYFNLFKFIHIFIFVFAEKRKSNNHCPSNGQKFHFRIRKIQYLSHTPLSIRLNLSLYVLSAAAEDAPRHKSGYLLYFSLPGNWHLFGKASQTLV